MLLKLTISNFAIIKYMVFEPSASLNIITGETGAGKSIIMDALGLILGSRADFKTKGEVDALKGEKCVVEGIFKLDKNKYQPVFEAMELDFEEETIIRREINDNGKSRSFINDTPVSLLQIKSITTNLVSIHSQHENSQLTEREFQFNLLDTYTGQLSEVNNFRADFSHFKRMLTQLSEYEKQQHNLLKEKDYLNYLFNEFEQAGLKDNEEELLERELNLLANAEAIEIVSNALIQSLSDSEISVTDTLNRLKVQLKTIAHVNALSKELFNRIDSSIIELKDIASEAVNLKQSAMPDGNRLEEVNARLQMIQNLKRKHGISDFADLIGEQEKISDKLLSIGNIDHEIETLRVTITVHEKKLNRQASILHSNRMKSSIKLESEIKHMLSNLEMPKADIKFEVTEKSTIDEFGKTDLTILFSANVGMQLQLLSKVASGGELSRLALCFRSIEAENSDLSTLIFDEIDTGVSGKVADTIGSLFEKLSFKHQVIAITHLPQVASYGDSHFMIGKKEENNKTISYLKRLDREERVDELAKMLSGNVATEIAKKNAMELLKN